MWENRVTGARVSVINVLLFCVLKKIQYLNFKKATRKSISILTFVFGRGISKFIKYFQFSLFSNPPK